VLEHVLMSSPMSDGASVCERVEQAGGTANADTGLEQMRFYVRVHERDAEEAVNHLTRAVLSPRFDHRGYGREREVVLRELAGTSADPCEAVQDDILAALFAGHPLGRPVGGVAAEVAALTPERVAREHADRFLCRPVSAVIVGPEIPRPEYTVLSDVMAEDRAEDIPEPLPELVRQEVYWPDGYAWACLGARSPGFGDRSEPAYRVLAELCGRSACSLLYKKIRNELGLAYEFEAWNRGYLEAGAWRLLLGVDKGTGPKIMELVLGLLGELASAGPTGTDLAAAKRQTEMRLVTAAEDPLEYAKSIAGSGRWVSQAWSPEEELSEIMAVAPEHVAEAAQSVLDNHVIVVRPSADGIS
jgi:predicted Zn-dependent peptidase